MSSQNAKIMDMTVSMNCSIDDCERQPRSRGWCIMHYNQWSRASKPKPPSKRRVKVAPVKKQRLSAEEQYLSKVVKGEGCWGWKSGSMDDGYGQFRANGVRWYAHRFSYVHHIGPIPAGMEVDHSCHNEACSNPLHLRLATHKQNTENLQGARRNSRTGVRGVCQMSSGKYIARVGHNGRKIYVGVFASLSEADAAVSAKRNELFTHNIADRVAA